MGYLHAKQVSQRWLQMGELSVARFGRFLREVRGLPPLQAETPLNIAPYQTGLPDWLVETLTMMLHRRQRNWRVAQRRYARLSFWNTHTRLFRWLFVRPEIGELGDITRDHLDRYIDAQLADGYQVRSINLDLRAFQGTLRFLAERGREIPRVLLRQKGLRVPDSLPRFLTDAQVGALQAEMERHVAAANTPARRRNALMDRAFFYLLWQGGLRAAEVEDLLLEDLNLDRRQLCVRRGKGQRDRTIYLTDATCAVLAAYLAVRGSGVTGELFLYRHAPLGKDLVRNRIKAAGKRCGVKVTPHRLRHTHATQLVNAGADVTTIKALLGHRFLATTQVYARVHDQTVADDYFTAMAAVEEKMAGQLAGESVETTENTQYAAKTALLTNLETLRTSDLDPDQQALVALMRRSVLVLLAEV